ncbi:MAG: 3-deoxy-manno-octulosonate cytidylyltransferase [Armatimonadetes bacterium]|nr:3-deoxy-manno-octulosonate cytidylyltransferase [Armatimonadota bacterium]
MNGLIVIPARMASTRFPGKPLVDLCGRPMLQWVVDAARGCQLGDNVLVATPDDEVLDYCRAQGIDCERTSISHPSGTDRIAEISTRRPADFYINVQGDEPLLNPGDIDACITPFLEDPSVEMASLWAVCPEDEESNPAVVKVVLDLSGNALYFSRHAIPFPRNPRQVPLRKHLGLYGYRKSALDRFATWSPSPLELTESLEQLRFLENGVKIKMVEGKGSAMAVDTPEQAEQVRQILQNRT